MGELDASSQQLLAAKTELEQKLEEQLSSNVNLERQFEAEEQAMILSEELAVAKRRLEQAEKQLELEQFKAKDLQVSWNS